MVCLESWVPVNRTSRQLWDVQGTGGLYEPQPLAPGVALSGMGTAAFLGGGGGRQRAVLASHPFPRRPKEILSEMGGRHFSSAW